MRSTDAGRVDTAQQARPARSAVGNAHSSALREQIDSLAPWFHNLHLDHGVQTAPDHPLGDFPAYKWREIEPHIPTDLRGSTVIDIGCNGGFYSFALARRGADVLAIDVDSHYLRQARWACEHFGLTDRVRFQQMQVYDLARLDQRFDLVWFMGVFYHLRYPLLGLDIAAEKTKRLLVFQSMTMPANRNTHERDVPADLPLAGRAQLAETHWPKMAFIEHRLAGDPTNWWAPDATCVEAMLRSAGLRIVSQPGDEVYICEPVEQQSKRDEMRAATGNK